MCEFKILQLLIFVTIIKCYKVYKNNMNLNLYCALPFQIAFRYCKFSRFLFFFFFFGQIDIAMAILNFYILYLIEIQNYVQN